MGDAGNVEAGIEILQRIKSRMIAKVALDDLLLRGIDVALDNEVAILGDADVARQRLDQTNGLLAQETCQQILVHIIGHRGCGGIGVCGIASERYNNGHTLAQSFIGIVVAGTRLMDVPVHTR